MLKIQRKGAKMPSRKVCFGEFHFPCGFAPLRLCVKKSWKAF
jgi:hypothetical protein